MNRKRLHRSANGRLVVVSLQVNMTSFAFYVPLNGDQSLSVLKHFELAKSLAQKLNILVSSKSWISWQEITARLTLEFSIKNDAPSYLWLQATLMNPPKSSSRTILVGHLDDENTTGQQEPPESNEDFDTIWDSLETYGGYEIPD